VSVYGVLPDSANATGVAALGVPMAAGVALEAVGFIAGVDPAAGAGRGLALCGGSSTPSR
jgi:hypothetical protein